MEQPNLPTQEGLNALYGAWNPMAYMQGHQNQGLADQFRQQAFNRNALDTFKVQQGVEQDSRMNPLLLEQQRGNNTKLGFENIMTQRKNEREQANHQNMLDADQRAAALKVSEDDMKKFEYKVGELMRSPDKRENDLAAVLQQKLVAFQAERRAHADKLAVETTKGEYDLKGRNITAGSNERINNANIAAGKFDKKKSSSAIFNIQTAVQTGKMSAEQAAVALNSAAMFAEDPEAAAKYQTMAGQYEQLAMQLKNAAAGSKPDLNQMGVPTNKVTPALGSSPKAISSGAPTSAEAHLKSNPALAAAFDAKYGAGAAAKVLGK